MSEGNKSLYANGKNNLDKSRRRGALAGIIVGSVLLVAGVAAASYVTMKTKFPSVAQSFTPTSAMQSPLARP